MGSCSDRASLGYSRETGQRAIRIIHWIEGYTKPIVIKVQLSNYYAHKLYALDKAAAHSVQKWYNLCQKTTSRKWSHMDKQTQAPSINQDDHTIDPAVQIRDRYINLLKKQLIGMIYEDIPVSDVIINGHRTRRYVKKFREYGRDLPSKAHSMIGLHRMNNIQACVAQIVADGVPGDLIETGVWRGGATIFMRGLLAAYGITDRTVWVADSFQGLPVPDVERYPIDAGWAPQASFLTIPEEQVRDNFARYDLLDDQVRFLAGWFKDTLPAAPIEQLSLMRLDGDLYGSTWDALSALYPKLAPGGFVIIDDYRFPSCRNAVNDYRDQHGIDDPILKIDEDGVFWRRARA